MIENASYIQAGEKAGYSELKVMRSRAGWYVGTEYTDPERGLTEPGSRDSGYFPTREAAAEHLVLLEARLVPVRAAPSGDAWTMPGLKAGSLDLAD